LSEYYHSDQVSIHVHVIYLHTQHSVDNIKSTNENRHIIKEYHFYISHYLTHDAHYVQHCFHKQYDSLKSRGIEYDQHWIWSDGCAGQFKYSISFYWLCHLHNKSNIKHCWNLFETSYGKREHNGAGACVKRAFQTYQMNPSIN